MNGFLPSLDHLIHSRQHVRGNREADLLGGFQVDHKLELRRLLHGKIGWFGTFQDLVHVGRVGVNSGGRQLSAAFCAFLALNSSAAYFQSSRAGRTT